MKKEAYIAFPVVKQHLMRDPEFRKAHAIKEPEFALRRALVEARLKLGLTQKEIAKRAGTTQSAIARFESSRTNPTLEFMQKVSEAVGARLEIRLVQNRT